MPVIELITQFLSDHYTVTLHNQYALYIRLERNYIIISTSEWAINFGDNNCNSETLIECECLKEDPLGDILASCIIDIANPNSLNTILQFIKLCQSSIYSSKF